MENTEQSISVLVAMLGARMHWAVPEILENHGMLARLFTDFDARTVSGRVLSYVPKLGFLKAQQRLIDRSPRNIPASKVKAFNSLGIRYAVRRKMSPGLRTFLWANRKFCDDVARQTWPELDAVFTYNGAGLEILEKARTLGKTRIIEQTIAPYAIERELLEHEYSRYADWETRHADAFCDDYIHREESEWKLANGILCGSQFVADGLKERGVACTLCHVVPYGVRSALPLHGAGKKVRQPSPRLRVLTVGTLSLRKGMPYIAEVAKKTKQIAEFRAVGPTVLSPIGMAKFSECVEVTGSIPRSQLHMHFDWADVFFLPSLCEGSATVTYEAMAHGLPIICTHNTGSLTRDGIEGRVVRIRDVDAMCDVIAQLHAEPELQHSMCQNALNRSIYGGFDAYSARFVAATNAIHSRRNHTVG
jgi:glycosyltransferase involved in cell wall biosynthesis